MYMFAWSSLCGRQYYVNSYCRALSCSYCSYSFYLSIIILIFLYFPFSIVYPSCACVRMVFYSINEDLIDWLKENFSAYLMWKEFPKQGNSKKLSGIGGCQANFAINNPTSIRWSSVSSLTACRLGEVWRSEPTSRIPYTPSHQRLKIIHLIRPSLPPLGLHFDRYYSLVGW